MPRCWFAALTLAGLAVSCGAPPRNAEPRGDGYPDPPAGIASPPSARWVVDPKDPGPTLPPAGRSLFDFVVTRDEHGRRVYDVPYPFPALVASISGRLERAGSDPPLKMVLIPRGRSLQRDAARPDFFRFPRAVLAVDGEPRVPSGHSGAVLKDRLYLGYQENANLIEVISYNEAAGRFEFQVVRDYREGGTPRVVYANRALCMACHQNAGPIFARPLWDETNANTSIAALLTAERREFYGFPRDPGVDVPYLIDNATDRANLFSAWQLLWREGCGGADPEAVRCRANLLTFALQHRLSGGGGFDTRSSTYRQAFLPALARRARVRWPDGWSVPTADVPNRNPMLGVDARPARLEAPDRRAVPESLSGEARTRLAELVRHSDVPSQFEPLLPREPLARWPPPGGDEAGVQRAVAGLSEFLAEADARRLDAHLARLGAGPGAVRRTLAAVCSLEESAREDGSRRLSFTCRGPEARPREADAVFALEGRLYLDGSRVLRGSIDAIEVDGVREIPELEITGGARKTAGGEAEVELRVVQATSRLRARRASGEAVEAIVIAWKRDGATPPGPGSPSPQTTGHGLLRTVDDFGRVRSAIDALARRTSAGELDALAAKPFRRASVLKALEAELGLPPLAWCCDDTTAMPEPVLDAHAGDEAGRPRGGAPPHHQVFLRYCGRCHETADPFPPNFLHGTPAEVEANLAQCAERIFFRLGMWQEDAAARPKTPMPPENALPGLAVSPEEWPGHPDLRALRDYAGGLLRTPSDASPNLATLEARGYGSLRACLAEPRLGSGELKR